ncbi:hypothetical protein BK133_04110 [Paenibacillus sp. FSL H8-0548]|uniref:LysM peptidoglycan-binding domain-containing protein n=1 Tax=Paenibacillus sp. FSL H8-0548 TaxID=1920422 RepID=UPI00096C8205|nr:LysM peptidoglycan-binding domain-containing protein [Paenibacillus sp. FSL H8-0548]OMF37730.1 hypothetical protein BK133_04110 [Paenibacillus sp. FSL H8-0548]
MNNATERSNKRRNGSSVSLKKTTLIIYLAILIILASVCGVLYSKYTNLVDANSQAAAVESSGSTNEQTENNGFDGKVSLEDDPVPAGTIDVEEEPKPAEDIEENTNSSNPAATDAPVKQNNEQAVPSVPKQTEKPIQVPEKSDDKTTAPSSSTVKLPTTYVVQKGDTLSSISEKFYQSKEHYALLAESNQILFINDMKAGDTLTIPALPSKQSTTGGGQDAAKDYSKITLPATYLIQAGDTLSGVSRMFYKSAEYVDYIAEENKLDKTKGLKAGTNLIIPSLKNYKPDTIITPEDNLPVIAATNHTVKAGETLYSISKIYFGSNKYALFIADYNHIVDIDNVKAGTVLKIPKE